MKKDLGKINKRFCDIIRLSCLSVILFSKRFIRLILRDLRVRCNFRSAIVCCTIIIPVPEHFFQRIDSIQVAYPEFLLYNENMKKNLSHPIYTCLRSLVSLLPMQKRVLFVNAPMRRSHRLSLYSHAIDRSGFHINASFVQIAIWIRHKATSCYLIVIRGHVELLNC